MDWEPTGMTFDAGVSVPKEPVATAPPVAKKKEPIDPYKASQDRLNKWREWIAHPNFINGTPETRSLMRSDFEKYYGPIEQPVEEMAKDPSAPIRWQDIVASPDYREKWDIVKKAQVKADYEKTHARIDEVPLDVPLDQSTEGFIQYGLTQAKKGLLEDSAYGEQFGQGMQSAPSDKYGMLTRMGGQLVGDVYGMIAGGIVGPAGAFATPEALRQYYRAKRLGQIDGNIFKLIKDTANYTNYWILKNSGRWKNNEDIAARKANPVFNRELEEGETGAKIFLKTAEMGAVGKITGELTGLLKSPAMDKFYKVAGDMVEKASANGNREVLAKLGDVMSDVSKKIDGSVAKKYADKAADSLLSNDYVGARKYLRYADFASKVTPVMDIVAAGAPMTLVPPVLEGRMPTGDEAWLNAMAGIFTHSVGALGSKVKGKIIGSPINERIAKSNFEVSVLRNAIDKSIREIDMAPEKGMENMNVGTTISSKSIDQRWAGALENHKELATNIAEKIVGIDGLEDHARFKAAKKAVSEEQHNIIEEAEKKSGLTYKPQDIRPIEEFNSYVNLPDTQKNLLPETELLRQLRGEVETAKIDYLNRKYIELTPEKKAMAVDMMHRDIFTSPIEMRQTGALPEMIREGLNVIDYAFEGKKPKADELHKVLTTLRPLLAKTPKELKQYFRWDAKAGKAETGAWVPKREYVRSILREFEIDEKEPSGPRNVALAGIPVLREVLSQRYFKDNGLRPDVMPGTLKVWGKNFGYYSIVSTNPTIARKMFRGHGIIQAEIETGDLFHTGEKHMFVYMPHKLSVEELVSKGPGVILRTGDEIRMQANITALNDVYKSHGVDGEAQIGFLSGDKAMEVMGGKDAEIKYTGTRTTDGKREMITEIAKPDEVAVTDQESLIYKSEIAYLQEALQSAVPGIWHQKLQYGVHFFEGLGPYGKILHRAIRNAEGNSIRMVQEAINRGRKTIFEIDGKKFTLDEREHITLALMKMSDLAAKFVEDIGATCAVERRAGKHFTGEQLFSMMSDRQKAAAQMLKAEFVRWFNEINTAREACGREPIKSIDQYFPIMDKSKTQTMSENISFVMGLMRVSESGQDIVRMPETEVVARIKKEFDPANAKAQEIPFSAVKSRKYYKAPIELDSQKIYEKYSATAARYVNLTPVISKMADLLDVHEVDGIPFSMITDDKSIANYNRIKGDLAYMTWGRNALDHWANGLTENQFRKARGAIDFLMRNVVASLISFNANTVINQLPALRNSIVYLGPRTAFCMFKYAMSPKIWHEAFRESNAIYSRWHEPFVDLVTGVGKVRDKVMKIGALPMRGVDMFIAMATWKAAKEKYLIENPGKTRASIEYADDIVTKSQASVFKIDKAPWQRSTLGALVTMFCNYSIAEWNMQIHDILGYQRKLKPGEKVAAAASWLAGTILWNTFSNDILGMESMYPSFISAAQDAIDKGATPTEAIMSISGEALKFHPLLQGSRVGGEFSGALMTQFGNITRAAADPRFAVKGAWSAAYLTGIPGAAQVKRIVRQTQEGETDPLAFIINKKFKEQHGNSIFDSNKNIFGPSKNIFSGKSSY